MGGTLCVCSAEVAAYQQLSKTKIDCYEDNQLLSTYLPSDQYVCDSVHTYHISRTISLPSNIDSNTTSNLQPYKYHSIHPLFLPLNVQYVFRQIRTDPLRLPLPSTEWLSRTITRMAPAEEGHRFRQYEETQPTVPKKSEVRRVWPE